MSGHQLDGAAKGRACIGGSVSDSCEGSPGTCHEAVCVELARYSYLDCVFIWGSLRGGNMEITVLPHPPLGANMKLGSVNFSHKGSESKYFWLCGLRYNRSTLTV